MSPLTHDEDPGNAVAPTDAWTARILETGADEKERPAVVVWLDANDCMGRNSHDEPRGGVAAMCESLKLLESFPGDELETGAACGRIPRWLVA